MTIKKVVAISFVLQVFVAIQISVAASSAKLAADVELAASNGGFEFNGIDQSINLGRSNILNLSATDFSIHVWVNLGPCSESPCDMSIVDKMAAFGDFNDDGWRLLKQSDDHFWFCLGAAGNGCQGGIGTTVISETVAVPNLWYSVAAVKTSNTISIYLNGALEASSHYDAFTDTSSADLLIGANNPEGAFLHGRVGEVELFSRALSDAHIRAIYARSKSKYGK